ncbi:MAG: GerMN domain-containing protein [Actinomycetota bacterium]|nr:GerMN domain-containing protein [Actinomycetota bacterium]
MRRTVLAVLALLVTAACGTDGGGSVDAGPVPSAPGATSTTSPSVSPGADGPAAGTTTVQLYFTRGESLRAVSRPVPRVARVGAEAVKALLAGPTDEESRSGLGTAIPRDTRFLDLVITDGVAKVDLSRAFESGGGTLSLTMRLAQVTCTLDQFESVRGVRFALDGKLVNVFSGNGIVLDQPVTCAGYGDLVRSGSDPAPAAFAGIWPFTSQAEADAYGRGSESLYRNAVDTAREFARRYVGMAEPVAIGGATPAGRLVEVRIGFGTGEGGRPIADPRPTMTVRLQSVGNLDGDRNPWTVVAATSEQIVVDSPKALDRVSSPVSVAGRAHVFEGNVTVEVREDGMLAGQSLGKGFVTGGGDALRPFSGRVTFRSPSKAAGAVVFYELSAADGQGVLRATVVRVRFT